MLRTPLAILAAVIVVLTIALAIRSGNLHRDRTGAATTSAPTATATPVTSAEPTLPPPSLAPGDYPQDLPGQTAHPARLQPTLPTGAELTAAQANDQLTMDLQAQGRTRATDIEKAATAAAGKWLLDDIRAARIWQDPQILAQAAVDRAGKQVTVVTIWRAKELSGVQLHRSESLMRLDADTWVPVL